MLQLRLFWNTNSLRTNPCLKNLNLGIYKKICSNRNFNCLFESVNLLSRKKSLKSCFLEKQNK